MGSIGVSKGFTNNKKGSREKKWGKSNVKVITLIYGWNAKHTRVRAILELLGTSRLFTFIFAMFTLNIGSGHQKAFAMSHQKSNVTDNVDFLGTWVEARKLYHKDPLLHVREPLDAHIFRASFSDRAFNVHSVKTWWLMKTQIMAHYQQRWQKVRKWGSISSQHAFAAGALRMQKHRRWRNVKQFLINDGGILLHGSWAGCDAEWKTLEYV
jgi:hypothetical protein